MDIKKWWDLLKFFIIFLTSFIAGYNVSVLASNSSESYFEKINFVKKFINTSNNNWIENLGDLILRKDLDLNQFWKAYNIISKNYYSSDTIKQQDLVYWATKWLVEAMWDKFSEFMPPEENKKFMENLSWDFEWIWAVVDKNEMWVVVDRVIKGSPALKNDIRKWDIIMKANDENLSDFSLYDAVAKIKWAAGTKVKLTIFRAWEKELLKKEVTREKITIPSVDSKIIEKTDKDESTLTIKSDKCRKKIETRLLHAYDTIRKRYRNGLAIVMVKRSACGGCFNQIPPQVQLEIAMHKKIIACEHCGRVLVDDLIQEVEA